MQCKDIPDEPILKFLAGPYEGWPVPGWGTWFPGFANSVQNAMPAGVCEKLALAKMRMLIRRGLVGGCGCGCRGDFQITDAGRAAHNTGEHHG
jgi:hypothetical protein